MHDKQLYHGDIKPANIFYSKNIITTDIGTVLDLSDNKE
jgi:serine/threonine protein kinase